MLIAAVDLLQQLKTQTRTLDPDTEVVAFADTDVLRALDVISRRRPRLVALEKTFAATPRGVALVSRLRADPAQNQLEIRIVSPETAAGSGRPAATAASVPTPATRPTATPNSPLNSAQALDYRGTRGAVRYQMAAAVAADVNGNPATMVDLSTGGAQVLSETILKPNQRVRVTFSDERTQVRCQAVVAWASFEMPSGSGPRYRAGLQFVDANPATIDAFRVRHQTV